MLRRRAPWWMYALAAVFTLTFLFNARQEALGPVNAGWIPSWPSLKAAGVIPGSPMEKAGLLAAGYRRAHNILERRRMGALCLAFAFFGLLVVHNLFTRNWTIWFGTPAPAVGSGMSFVAEAVLFPIIPLVLSWSVLANPPAQSSAAKSRM
jgi:hypothetical protein